MIRSALSQMSRHAVREIKFIMIPQSKRQPRLAPGERAFLEKLQATVEKHLGEEKFSVAQLSREMGMSRSQIHRKLRALIGQTPRRFIRAARLRHARALLEQGRLTVTEIAYRAGFSSPAYFAHCFRREFGLTPAQAKMRQN
jgi:AraC-like DNA-binding protein